MGQLQARYQRRAMKAAGGILSSMAGKALAKVGKVSPLARVIPGVGTAMAVAGMASSAGSAVARKVAVKTPSGATVRPLAAMPGGVPLYSKKKYRRQNVGNMKALRRAIRRIQGAEKLFRTVLSVQGKAHAGIKPKKKR